MSRADDLLAAIRAHCLECSGGSRAEVRRCKVDGCALWPYRRSERKAATEEVDIDGQMSIYDLQKAN